MDVVVTGSLVIGVFGCKDKPAAETSPAQTSAAEPEKAAPAAKPVEDATLTLAAGETFVQVPPKSTNPLAWATGGQSVQVAIVASGDKAHVRAVADGAPVDLASAPLDEENTTYDLQVRSEGVDVMRQTRIGRVAGVGAVFEYEHWLVTFDAAAKKPVATRWYCSEEKGAECKGPAWTEAPGAPAASATKLAPTFAPGSFKKVPAEAKAAAESFVTALMNDDSATVLGHLTPTVGGCNGDETPDQLRTKIDASGLRTALGSMCTTSNCTWGAWSVMYDAKGKRLGVEPADSTGSHGYIFEKQADGAWKVAFLCANNSLVDPNVVPD